MINFVKQNIVESDADYICHQVNCRAAMNSGVAKVIRERWPIVYTTYMRVCTEKVSENEPIHTLLGSNLYVNINDCGPTTWPQSPIIINMFAQDGYGYDGKRYTSYDAFWSCLGYIKEAIPKGSKLAFPYKIGCDRGGANWNVIFSMIKEVLDEDYNIEFCYLEEDNWITNYIITNLPKHEEKI
jgi:O-acetyl-ADP-ribose deacetylase (regulator of RNase III)